MVRGDEQPETACTCMLNSLSGPIPPELGRLTGLRRLWLDRNQLSGSIPPALGQYVQPRER